MAPGAQLSCTCVDSGVSGSTSNTAERHIPNAHRNLCREEFPDYWVPPLSAPLWLSVPVLILSRTLK